MEKALFCQKVSKFSVSTEEMSQSLYDKPLENACVHPDTFLDAKSDFGSV